MISRTKVEKVIGKTYADSLDEIVFDTDGMKYTRRELVEQVGCASFMAVARLNRVLDKLDVHTPTQLFRIDPVSLARTRGIGEACIFAAMCILEFEGYDCLVWWKYDKNTSVKFSTYKHRKMVRASKGGKHELQKSA